MTVTFTIPQPPRGKSRHNTVITLRCSQCEKLIVGQRDRCPHCSCHDLYFVKSNEYTPKDQKEYERFCAMCAHTAMTNYTSLGELIAAANRQTPMRFTGPVKVECKFYFEIPKTGANRKKAEGDPHTQRPDLDNCIKSVWDAMNEICFADDCTVVMVNATKKWTAGVPRTEVRIESL